MINLYWIDRKKVKTDTDSLDIPVYENIFREHFICKLNLAISGNKDDTILKGIAICIDS
jgi:hypothetical protein